MTERKRFDKSLYEAYDQRARDVTTAYLASLGIAAEPHPNRYAQDLIAYNPFTNTEYHVECEVKIVWEGTEFPYENVQLPKRKHKFFDGQTQFFIWNEPLTHAASFWDYDISELIPVEVPNRYVSKGEYFYQIPLELIEWVGYETNSGHRDEHQA